MSDRYSTHTRKECVCALDDYLKLAEEWRAAGHIENDMRAALATAENKAADLRKRMWAAKAVLDNLLQAEAIL